MIHDATRDLAVLHPQGNGFFITDTKEIDHRMLQRLSPQEMEYRRLWRTFFDNIAIEARKNPALQNQNLPKRFRKDIVEFNSIDI